MDQPPQGLVYCCAPQCHEASKIMKNLPEYYNSKHNGHKIQPISQLRKELQSLDIYKYRVNNIARNNKDAMMKYIDDEISVLLKLFTQTVYDLAVKLKQYVEENLTPLKNVQLLFQAIVDNNSEMTYYYQNSIELLKKSKQFQEQEHIAFQVRHQLVQSLKVTSDKMVTLNQIKLQRPIANIFTWSPINKHGSMQIVGNTAKFDQGWQTGAICLEPKLSMDQIITVQLKATRMQDQCFIQLCDLNVLNNMSPTFIEIHYEGFGAYSHQNNGSIHGTETYGQGITQSFKFQQGDYLELQWNGPLKKFTTMLSSTGEQFEFNAKFNQNADIHFAVSFFGAGTMEIL